MQPSIVSYVVVIVLVMQGNGSAGADTRSCREGTPEFVDHVSPQRLWQDPTDLRARWERQATTIQDEDLGRRLMMAFDGMICTRDIDLLVALTRIFSEADDGVLRVESLHIMKYLHFDSVLKASRAGLHDPLGAVRLASLAVTSRRQDRHSIAAVRGLAEGDPKAEVRKYAEKVLRHLEEVRSELP